MKYILTFMIMLNITFCFFKHPMTMAINLIMQTIITIILLNSMNLTSWFSYIMFLIMIGALIVLFIYMTSLTSNKKFKFNLKMFFFVMMILFIFLSYQNDQMIFFLKTLTEESINFLKKINNNFYNEESLILSPMYNQLEKLLTMILIMYLLYVLIIIVKIVDIKKGTMRKMN